MLAETLSLLVIFSRLHRAAVCVCCGYMTGPKICEVCINLARGVVVVGGGGGSTMIGTHEAHSNIFFSSQELVRRHCC